MFGREVRLPADVMYGLPTSTTSSQVIEVNQYVCPGSEAASEECLPTGSRKNGIAGKRLYTIETYSAGDVCISYTIVPVSGASVWMDR